MKHNLYVLRGRQKKRRNKKWLHRPCLLGARKGGGTAMQPLRSLGFRTKGDKIRSGYISLAVWGPKSGHNSYITPAISGVPRIGDKITSNCITPRRPKLGGSATQPLSCQGLPNKGAKTKMVLAPMPSWEPGVRLKCNVTSIFWGVAKKGEEIRSGYIALAFLGAEKGAEWLCNPYVLGSCAQKEIKSKVAT